MNTDTIKKAEADYPILDVIARRWSPYLMDGRPVEREKLLTCLEAARWAPSSFNEQPWSFLVAEREDTEAFERMLGCLVEANQQWARHAGVLMITVIRRRFSRNEKPNRVAEHDLGLAAGFLTLQAVDLGLHVHQMAGINIERARATYHVPEGYEPLTAIAIGHAGDPEQAEGEDRELGERDEKPRSRKALGEFVFSGEWGKAM